MKLNNDDDMRTCEENENSVRSRGSRSGAAVRIKNGVFESSKEKRKGLKKIAKTNDCKIKFENVFTL